MTADDLRGLQAPLKQQYRDDPDSAVVTTVVRGRLDVRAIACRIETSAERTTAGLHPAAGGDDAAGCSAEWLLESLVGCAGTTLCAVATAMQLPVAGGAITARGLMDFRGTLGVDRNTPVGMTAITLQFDLATDATNEQVQKLIQLTERYCVVMQTLRSPPEITVMAQPA